MALRRLIKSLAVAWMLLAGWPPDQARGGVPFPVADVAWTMSPLLTDCEGPCDAPGFCWYDSDFSETDWQDGPSSLEAHDFPL
jgi:hypothetical protein